MNFLDAALQFNRRCPKGTPVEIVLRSGEVVRTKTSTAAYVWGTWALVELEGRHGCFQVEHVHPIHSEQATIATAASEYR